MPVTRSTSGDDDDGLALTFGLMCKDPAWPLLASFVSSNAFLLAAPQTLHSCLSGLWCGVSQSWQSHWMSGILLALARLATAFPFGLAFALSIALVRFALSLAVDVSIVVSFALAIHDGSE